MEIYELKKTKDVNNSNVKTFEYSGSAFSQKAFQSAYAKWERDELAAYRDTEPAKRYSSLDEYLSSNAVFLTITFHRNLMAKRKRDRNLKYDDVSLELDAFHWFYRTVSRRALGNHWDRLSQSDRWLFAMVAIDHPEAKYARVTTSRPVTNLHIHAVLVCRSNDQAAFSDAIRDEDLIAQMSVKTLADAIDVKAWDSSLKAGYISKSHVKAFSTARSGMEELRIYPNPSGQGRLGWGYTGSYGKERTSWERLVAGLRRSQFADHWYARSHGPEH